MHNLSKAYFLVSGVGIAIAIYLAYEYLTLNFNSCNVSQQFSCGGVFQSGYTSLFGIPFFVMGLVWFPLVLAVGLVITRGGKNPLEGEILLPLLMVGNVFTFYLWYLELDVIGIVCPLCVSLYMVNYALTGIAAHSIF